MTNILPPTIDARASERWRGQVPRRSPWLHEEVARRMESRLQWIVRQPDRWLHWNPLQGGRSVHAALMQRYPAAKGYVHQYSAAQMQVVRSALQQPWWKPSRWRQVQPEFGLPPQPVDMVWANMVLHMEADPQAAIRQWQAALAPDGFLMFSCLGPDTLKELRAVYAECQWPAPSHDFTDMHDWGDMLVQEGFAEPVMDMERITLTYSTAETLLAELRELGRNLNVNRFPALRGRAWRNTLCQRLEQALRTPDGTLALTFEVVYGHAFKAPPRFAVQAESRVPLSQLKSVLARKK